jgi:tetratricopeptide (TPR) repeat protein
MGIDFHGPVIGGIFNYGDQHGVCVTGDGNSVYQIVVADRDHLEKLLAEIKGGRAVESVAEAVRLHTFIMQVTPLPAEDKAPPRWKVVWQVAGRMRETVAEVEVPSPLTSAFVADLGVFYGLSSRALEKPDERVAVNAAAVRIGETLAELLPKEQRKELGDLSRADGPPPFLVIESDDDVVLALPWELLRIEEGWSVREGRLDVARRVPNAFAGDLTPPKTVASVHVNVCAPEDHPGLSYEKESYRIHRALQEHPDVRTNEMGELDDLLNVVCSNDPPVCVHFSGHGGAGVLLFEDPYGRGRPVPAKELIAEMRRKGVQRWPRLFYLSCCHGQDPAGGGDGEVTSTAAQLHREGIPQVVAHFGPVYDHMAINAEEAFYAEVAKGRRTRDAVRAARNALAVPFSAELDAPPPTGDGIAPFAWALLALYHAGEDYPLSVPVQRHIAEGGSVRVRRRDVELHAGGRTKVLRAGFIGRRKELHDLRRRLRDGANVHVVQGLGGLGKSVFCYKALKLLAESGYVVHLPLWCAAVEKEERAADLLYQQLVDELRKRGFGSGLEGLLQQLDRIPDAGDRAATLLRLVAEVVGVPPVAVYVDNLESLMRRPDEEDYDANAVAEWRDDNCRAFWNKLARVAREHPHRLALLASCRYRHGDFRAAETFPFTSMSDQMVFRMLEWFPALGRLSVRTHVRLAPELRGHPRSVEFLDGLVSAEIERWEADEGPLRPALGKEEAGEEWERFIGPVMQATRERLREDLLFDALWEKALRPPERRLLVRMTVLRRPADRDFVRALSEPDEKGRDFRRLLESGLIEVEAELDELKRTIHLFSVHPVVADFARQLAPEWETWRKEGFQLAGDFLEKRLDSASAAGERMNISMVLDAGVYLIEAEKVDRGWDRLTDAAEFFLRRGLASQALMALAPLMPEAVRKGLPDRMQAVLFGILSDCHTSRGDLEVAAHDLSESVTILEGLVSADPANIEWQRDLSVSYNKLGDVQSAQGNLAGARVSHGKVLEIAERLARQDPNNAEWQRDLSVSYEKLGDVQSAQGDLAGARVSYGKAQENAERLARQDPNNAGWQTDMIVSLVKISETYSADNVEERATKRTLLQRALEIAERIEREGRFTDHKQTKWPEILRQLLAALDDTQDSVEE